MVKKWHYLAQKRIPALLRGISSNNHGDFYCLYYTFIQNERKLQKTWKDMQ